MSPLPEPPEPAIVRTTLGARLRQLRESAGISPRQAALAIAGSDSKISRIELGRQAVRETDVADLLTLYGVTDPAQREPLLTLTTVASLCLGWQRYADAQPPWFLGYLGLEGAAESAEVFEPHAIPGLLQTESYALSLAGVDNDGDRAAAARLREVREARADAFRTRGGRLDCVIDEAVLHRPAGDFRAQLGYLREAAARPAVRVRIRRLAAGALGTPTPFTILRFADRQLPDLVYTEQLTGASFVERPAEVARYEKKIEQLRSDSAPADQTEAIIDRVLAEID